MQEHYEEGTTPTKTLTLETKRNWLLRNFSSSIWLVNSAPVEVHCDVESIPPYIWADVDVAVSGSADGAKIEVALKKIREDLQGKGWKTDHVDLDPATRPPKYHLCKLVVGCKEAFVSASAILNQRDETLGVQKVPVGWAVVLSLPARLANP